MIACEQNEAARAGTRRELSLRLSQAYCQLLEPPQTAAGLCESIDARSCSNFGRQCPIGRTHGSSSWIKNRERGGGRRPNAGQQAEHTTTSFNVWSLASDFWS